MSWILLGDYHEIPSSVEHSRALDYRFCQLGIVTAIIWLLVMVWLILFLLVSFSLGRRKGKVTILERNLIGLLSVVIGSTIFPNLMQNLKL